MGEFISLVRVVFFDGAKKIRAVAAISLGEFCKFRAREFLRPETAVQTRARGIPKWDRALDPTVNQPRGKFRARTLPPIGEKGNFRVDGKRRKINLWGNGSRRRRAFGECVR